jgi:hypothetical protein
MSARLLVMCQTSEDKAGPVPPIDDALNFAKSAHEASQNTLDERG